MLEVAMNLSNFLKDFYLFAYYYIIYAHLGWWLETIYASFKEKKFINRGFLFGPFCSMYGFGAVSLIYFLTPFENNLFLLFIIGVIITTVLEYITGYMLEKSFNTTWWDYSKEPLNLHGRICLSFSLLWGGISVILIKIINPIFNKYSYITNTFYGKIILSIILVSMLLDFILTLISITKFNYLLDEFKTLHEEFKTKLDIREKLELTHLEEQKIWQEFKLRYEYIYKKLQKRYSRYLNAFPKYTSGNLKSFKDDFKKKIHSKFKTNK